MEGREGKKMEEKKITKVFAKLPENYSEMSEEDQKAWRKQLAKAILEHHTR